MKTYTAVKLRMSKTASLSCICTQFGKPIRLHVPPWVIYKSDAVVLIHKKVSHTEEDIISVGLNIFAIDNRRDILDPFMCVCIIVGSSVK